MPKLHELIAALPDRAAAAKANVDETVGAFSHKANDLFAGQLTVVTAIDDARKSELDIREEKEITTTVHNRLNYTFGLIAKALDVQYQVDLSNMVAKADLIVNGVTIAKDVPATTLLHIEKQTRAWMEMVKKAPTLATGINWVEDSSKGANVYKTATPVQRAKTETIPYGLILAPATEKFQAQVVKETKVNVIARIDETKWSGMIPSLAKAEILSRLQELSIAAQTARQRANEVAAVEEKLGEVLVKFIMG